MEERSGFLFIGVMSLGFFILVFLGLLVVEEVFLDFENEEEEEEEEDYLDKINFIYDVLFYFSFFDFY